VTLAFAIAIAGALALTPLAGRFALKLGAVSRPDGKRKLHSRPTPLCGGIALYLALLLSVAVSYSMVLGEVGSLSLPIALGLSAGMLCLLGAYDDFRDIRAGWKLLGQIVATLPIVLAGYYIRRLTGFGYCIDLCWFGVPWTVGWLVLGINAINLLDGIDGLASVIGIAISVAVAVIAGSQGRPEVMLLALALAGALAGFLVYNLPPARIYLGDCGSMVIGLALSVLVLQVSLAAPITANVTVAAALLFVPFLDTALAVVRRTLTGRSIMVADRGHIHHRLLEQGFSIGRILGLLGGFCLTTGAVACWVATSGGELWAWIIFPAVTALLVKRQLVGHEEWALTKRHFSRTAVSAVQRLSRVRRVSRLRRPTAISKAGFPDEPTNEEVTPSERARRKTGIRRHGARKAA
jgi:UDP-GlcNAc:undecaprenyl-phosphate GlcNAc-1-phosphate transferase